MFGGETLLHVTTALDKLRANFRLTPFKSIDMKLESRHPGVILLDKKRYCKDNGEKGIKFTGVSAARRNALGLCREACTTVAKAILHQRSLESATLGIACFLDDVSTRALKSSLTLTDVSMIARRNGLKCRLYTRVNGKEVRVPLGEDSKLTEPYDIEHVIKLVRDEVMRFTVPCGLESLLDLCSRSPNFSDWV